jgi:hypothetical protein
MLLANLQQDVDLNGFSIVPQFLDSDEIDSLLAAISDVQEDDSVRRRGGVYAIRNLLGVVPAITLLAASAKVTRLVRSVLGETVFAVRGILFDKTANANWLVPWHQDLTISVKENSPYQALGHGQLKQECLTSRPPPASSTPCSLFEYISMIVMSKMVPCVYCPRHTVWAGSPANKYRQPSVNDCRLRVRSPAAVRF